MQISWQRETKARAYDDKPLLLKQTFLELKAKPSTNITIMLHCFENYLPPSAVARKLSMNNFLNVH